MPTAHIYSHIPVSDVASSSEHAAHSRGGRGERWGRGGNAICQRDALRDLEVIGRCCLIAARTKRTMAECWWFMSSIIFSLLIHAHAEPSRPSLNHQTSTGMVTFVDRDGSLQSQPFTTAIDPKAELYYSTQGMGNTALQVYMVRGTFYCAMRSVDSVSCEHRTPLISRKSGPPGAITRR